MKGITSQSFKLRHHGLALHGAIRAMLSDSRCRVDPFSTIHFKARALLAALDTEGVLSVVG
jgi:hypothetical protein